MSDFNPVKIDYSLPTLSISAVLGLIQEPFDQKVVAEKTYNKHFNNPDSQYYQKTIEEICEMWSAKGAESCKYGSLLDDYIGINLTKTDKDLMLWKLDNNYEYDERLHAHWDAFDDFYNLLNTSGDYEFITRGKTIYYKGHWETQQAQAKGLKRKSTENRTHHPYTREIETDSTNGLNLARTQIGT